MAYGQTIKDGKVRCTCVLRCRSNINGAYRQRFNGLYPSDGQLFRGRFQAILVDAESYFLPLVSVKGATFNEPNRIAVYLTRQLRDEILAEIWREYGLKAQCSVSPAIKRVRN